MKGKEEKDSQTINIFTRACTPEKLAITRPTSLSRFARSRPFVKLFWDYSCMLTITFFDPFYVLVPGVLKSLCFYINLMGPLSLNLSVFSFQLCRSSAVADFFLCWDFSRDFLHMLIISLDRSAKLQWAGQGARSAMFYLLMSLKRRVRAVHRAAKAD
jgi:hypothetical protein